MLCDYIGYDSNDVTSASNCFHYVITIALSLKEIVWYVLSFYAFLTSVKDVRCQTYTTISQSYQWAFTSESTILQTEHSDEGGQKQDRK